MRDPFRLFWLMLTALLLSACAPSPPNVHGPDPAQIKAEITERFDAAYGTLLTVSDIELTVADSELNDRTHRVYDVKLTAVVQRDLRQALDALPENMENAIARGRIKGIMSLGAVQPGQKITTRLRALVEYDPEADRWSVVALIRTNPKPAAEEEQRHA